MEAAVRAQDDLLRPGSSRARGRGAPRCTRRHCSSRRRCPRRSRRAPGRPRWRSRRRRRRAGVPPRGAVAVQDQAKTTIRRQYSHLFTPSVRLSRSSSTAELLVTGLADAVDDRRGADAVLLPPQVLVGSSSSSSTSGTIAARSSRRAAARSRSSCSRTESPPSASTRARASWTSVSAAVPGVEVLAPQHLFEELVLGPRAALLQGGDLVLEGLEFLRVGDRTVVHPLLLGGELEVHRLDLVLEPPGLARDGVGGRRISPRRASASSISLRAAESSSPPRAARGAVRADRSRCRSPGGRNRPVHAPHRSARVADAAG